MTGQVLSISEIPEEPPEILSEDGREVWRRILPMIALAPYQLRLRGVDLNTLVSYCDVVATKEKAMRELRKPKSEGGGEVVYNGKLLQKSPWLSIRDQCIELEKKLVQDLGFAPAVRERLKVNRDAMDGDDPNQLMMEF
jgi:P27 family predicted phage terminase small subunit